MSTSPFALKLLREDRLPDKTKLHAFKLLQTLAGVSRQIPKSYLVGMLAEYKVENAIVACGRSANIREGKLKGMVVAVKSIRSSSESNIDLIHAVCGEPGFSALTG